MCVHISNTSTFICTVSYHNTFFAFQVDEIAREYEHKLRDQLRVQTDAHTQHLAGALQTQAEQLESKWVTELEFKLTQQETFYQTELAKAVARLKGIESMVETVANAGIGRLGLIYLCVAFLGFCVVCFLLIVCVLNCFTYV